jgi:hypothetical protein
MAHFRQRRGGGQASWTCEQGSVEGGPVWGNGRWAGRRGPTVGERKRAGPKENNDLFYLFEIFQKRLELIR